MNIIKKISGFIEKILYYFCAGLIFLMTVVITAQVVSRYALGRSLTWSEELGRYLFVWITFLGIALGIKLHSHVALDILIQKLNGKSRLLLEIINSMLIAVVGLILLMGGISLVNLGAIQKSPSMLLPMNIVYSVIPMSGILILFFVSEQILILLHHDHT